MTAKRKAAATAVADVTEGVVLARVEIAAPPERVFRALTTEEVTKWWGAGDYDTTKFTIDLRPGGRWRTDGVGHDGHAFHVEGEVIEVDPPRRLVQTWKPSWDPGAPTRITYTFDAIDGGTRVTVRHTGFTNAASCDGHAVGWNRVLGWLAGHCAPAKDSYFLLRLIGPRPTFPMDMTEDERAVMNEHVAYMGSKLADGTLLAFGPVMDPKGPWGLGLARVADETELQALIAGDPTIKSNRGFRYETLPFAQLVH